MQNAGTVQYQYIYQVDYAVRYHMMKRIFIRTVPYARTFETLALFRSCGLSRVTVLLMYMYRMYTVDGPSRCHMPSKTKRERKENSKKKALSGIRFRLLSILQLFRQQAQPLLQLVWPPQQQLSASSASSSALL